MNYHTRTKEFSRNVQLEDLLNDINMLLWISEKNILNHDDSMKFPLMLIMGPMRSGTTLFMQWIANTGLISYPTNLLSRFYQAPIIGAKIQLLLTDPQYNYRDELYELTNNIKYISENGKTKGILAPNEFWYFWRRFLPDKDRDVWTDDDLTKNMDIQTMKAEIKGLIDLYNKPFAAKGMLFNYNIPFLNSIFKKIVFVQVKRDPVNNIASVLNARKKQFGKDSVWYSFKIPEYELIKDFDPITQSAAQVYYINQAVSEGMSKIPLENKLIVQYEEFCANPKAIFCQLIDKLGYNEHIDYVGVERFNPSYIKCPHDYNIIKNALDNFIINSNLSN